MRTALLLFLLPALLRTAAQDRFPFTPLEPPDTLRSAEALQELERRCDVIHANGQRVSLLGSSEMDEPSAVLVKPWSNGWLVYHLPVFRDVRNGYQVEGFTPDGRLVRVTTWSNNIMRGGETAERSLLVIDPERATHTTITTLFFEHTWEYVGDTDATIDRLNVDSTQVTITGTHVILANGCTVDGRPVQCADAGGAYMITPEALVKDVPISEAARSSSSAPLLDRDRFPFNLKDKLCPRLYGPNAELWPLDSTDRSRLLQDEASRYASSELYLFAQLPDAVGPRITMLCSNNDDHDLLWLSYDAAGVLNWLDTLASQYGDGQESRSECVYYDRYGVLLVEAMDEMTLRDEKDTMAYLRDTLVYEVRVTTAGYRTDAEGEQRSYYGLERVPMDLTSRWVECHGVNDRGPYRWHSLKELIPPHRRVLQGASGDLDRDGAADHVLVLTNEADDGERDLLIAFTAKDRCGFVQKALLSGFLLSRESGGFHDPIGEEGISGISINGDSLVIHVFGGSAWKWEERSVYQYSPMDNDFFLVREEGRSFHASSISTLDEDLRYFEEAAQQGRKLSAEEEERLAELRKADEAYRWKVTTYALGEKLMGEVDP